jgi:RimJ/RimL family protein N-acetyltransferase
MTSHHIHAVLARERYATFLAQTARLTRQAPIYRARASTSAAGRMPLRRLPDWLRPGWSRLPGHRPRAATEGRPAVLRDGSKVLIRPVRSTDAPLLADGFARLSAQSRQMRFLTTKNTLSVAELRYLTEIDHHDHEALGALRPADGRGAGVARYIRDADDPRAAEIAVTIADDWQGRGLGTELLAQLSDRARHAGIHRFTALVAADNAAMAALLRNMGADLADSGPGTVKYQVALVPEEYSLDWWFGCVDDGSVATRW